MKVLFTFGGLPHYYNLVLNRLNAIKGLEVVVAVPPEGGNTIGAGVHQSREGIDFRIRSMEEYKAFYGKPFLRGFLKAIFRERPDVLVTIWPYYLAFIYKPHILLMMRLLGIKIIFKDIPFQLPKMQDAIEYLMKQELRTEEMRTGSKGRPRLAGYLRAYLLTITRRLFFNLADAHVDYTTDAYEIFGSYGVKKEKIFIIYNSPDTDLLMEAKAKAQSAAPILPENPFRIIHVGRLVQWKRVDMLLRVTARLKQKYPKAELVVVGSGPQEKELKEMAVSLGIADSVTFTGAIYNTVELGRYFLASSVYVLAGMGGLSINEAMCFDRPVICSVCDGTEKELVKDGFNGFYFTEGDEDDLLGKIEKFFASPESAREFGSRSGSIIRNNVNIRTVINGYLRAFDYVTSNKYNLTAKLNQNSKMIAEKL